MKRPKSAHIRKVFSKSKARLNRLRKMIKKH